MMAINCSRVGSVCCSFRVLNPPHWCLGRDIYEFDILKDGAGTGWSGVRSSLQ